MGQTEITFIRPQEVYDRNTGESKVRYRSYDGNDRFIPVVDGEKGVPKTMVEVTHAELKAMRDGGKLTAGALYRITDYNCTTTQENTRSAVHQFDIVLLALSETKLAEEGWAMMHDNIYDVTFSDGVTKKCYLYFFADDDCNLVLVEDTTKGIQIGYGIEDFNEFDEQNKTATLGTRYDDIVFVDNVQYNYFQNSNLSAWKVWYCLDNDTTRFAWADDSVDEDKPASINNYWVRSLENDKDGKFAWNNDAPLVVEGKTLYTDKEIPEVGNTTYVEVKGSLEEYGTVSSYTPAQEGTGLPNGRGVIYRLIDEWNNDVGYDFKNIQFVRKLTDGKYDPNNGEDTWVYTFNLWYYFSCVDCSIVGNTLTDDVGDIIGVKNNVLNGLGSHVNDIADNVFLSGLDETWFYGVVDNRICGISTFSNTLSGFTVGIHSNTLLYVQQTTISGDPKFLIYCSGSNYEGDAACYIFGKKVLTES